MLGPWWGQGKDADAVSVLEGIKAQSPGATFVQGCTLSNDEPPVYDPANDCTSADGFADAVAAAKSADQVVLALGETREMSGEAASRTTLDLPGQQQELIDAIKATGTPFAVVLFNGRPLTLGDVAASRRRSSRPGSRVSRPVTRSPTPSSERSTPAESCRSRSRSGSARCRSTTTTCRPDAPATSPRSTTRATATCGRATRCTRSATG